MATYAATINGNKIFADRAEYTKKGVNIDESLEEIKSALAASGAFEVVSLNAQGKPDVASPSGKVIYLTKEIGSTKTDPYTEWIYVGSSWEIIGETSLDLSGYATKASLATVATSGSYGDLTNKPTIPDEQVNSDWNATSGKAQILNKPTLATVATSGDYEDLSNTPNLADVATSGSYNDLNDTPSIPEIGTVEL